MENLPPQELMKLWREGRTLYKACFDFGDAEFIDALPKWKESRPLKNTVSKDVIGILADGIQRIAQAHSEVEKFRQASQLARDRLINNLFQKITSGELLAVGYESPIKSDFPVYVPIYMWPPESIDVEKSIISAHGKTFIKVKIVKLETQTTPKNTLPDVKVQSEKVGRPSVGDQIISAFRELEKAGRINYSKSFQAHHQLLMETVLAIHGLSVSEKTLYKYLGKLFRDKKLKSTN